MITENVRFVFMNVNILVDLLERRNVRQEPPAKRFIVEKTASGSTSDETRGDFKARAMEKTMEFRFKHAVSAGLPVWA
jgi:hypothetical protein